LKVLRRGRKMDEHMPNVKLIAFVKTRLST